jgi:uncharacterized protein YcbX
MEKVGTLQAMYRHPVKAMRGEKLDGCMVDSFGLYGDRSHYFLDESRQGKYVSADKVPAMLGYTARFTGEGQETAYPEVIVASPQGAGYRWDDERFHAEIAQVANRPVTPVRRTPKEGGKNWEDHILIVTDSSLREIARLIGQSQLDARRFRPNLIIALDDDRPFAEDDWIGKKLRINDVLLQVNKHCERCMYVNIDPETLEINPAVLKAVVKRHDNRFGVYASVLQPGRLAVGQEVFVVSE